MSGISLNDLFVFCFVYYMFVGIVTFHNWFLIPG